jgi:hypothetical protein
MKSTAALILMCCFAAALPKAAEANPIVCCRLIVEPDAQSSANKLVITLDRLHGPCLAAGEDCPPTTAVTVKRDGELLALTLSASETAETCRYEAADTPTATGGVYDLELERVVDYGSGKETRVCRSGAPYGLQPDLGVPDLPTTSRDGAIPQDAARDARVAASGGGDSGCSIAGGRAVGPASIALMVLALAFWVRRVIGR